MLIIVLRCRTVSHFSNDRNYGFEDVIYLEIIDTGETTQPEPVNQLWK